MKTGVQGFHSYLRLLDSGFRRNDDLEPFSTFYDFIIIEIMVFEVMAIVEFFHLLASQASTRDPDWVCPL